jgi:hypothetical protein
MAWIKRNLVFAVGSAVALLMMGCAGWYLYSQWSANSKSQTDLDETYNQLQQVTHKNPAPGTPGGKVDNQKAAEDQIKQLAEINRDLKAHFTPIPSIPSSTNVSGREFATTLPGVLAGLTSAANAASVGLPPQYNFSFDAEVRLNTFAAGSLQALSAQLGEIKAICEVLFSARVNNLVGLRRERVSADDDGGSPVDYVDEKSKVTDLATVSPYEVTFDCFGPELTAVLAGFANSRYCIGVRSIAVEPTINPGLSTSGGGSGIGVMMDSPGGVVDYRTALGIGQQIPPGAGGMTPTRSGPVTFLDERKIRVTLMLEVVKLKSKP